MKTSRILTSSTINRAGSYGAPDFIMPLAALFFTPLPARSSPCALEALRRSLSGANIPIPGGTRTRYRYNSPVLGAPVSLIGSELLHWAPALFVVNRNICNFLWYGGVGGGAGEGLRSVEVRPIPQPRACALSCPSLAVYRAGALRGSGLYNACIVGRAAFPELPSLARPSLCPVPMP